MMLALRYPQRTSIYDGHLPSTGIMTSMERKMSTKRTEALRMLETQLRQKLMNLEGQYSGPVAAAWLPGGQPEIIEALQRVHAGTYGVCVDCGRNIPLTRLRARPEAARCIQCQSDYERRNGGPLPNARLAS
jgi:hypothetical protein